jgi:uncharacterized membrane protein YdjX (TVP38/TMEM64 family)
MFKKILIPFLISATLITVAFLLFGEMETFFVETLHHAENNKSVYSLLSFLILASDIILPVPSSIVMYTNGYVLGFFYGFFISLTALMVGAMVGYYLGKFTSMGVKAKDDQKADLILAKYGFMSILITRGIPIISESICLVCGYNKMPFKMYFILNLIGYIPVCILYAFCGSLGYNKDMFLITFGISLLISAAFWIFGKKFLTRYFNITSEIQK